MKVIHLFLILALLLLVNSCASLKGLHQSGGKQEIIQNAILDFSNTSKLYKKDSVFSISYQDTLYKMNLEELDNGTSRWVEGDIQKGIVAVSISANNNKLLLTSETKVGSKGELPSRFIEKEGKLFFWWDDDYPLTEEALAVLKKYDLLQDDEGGLITVPDFIIDDAQQGAHYYFCRNDISKYKRVITTKGMGYYDPPKLNCK
jgi:hypothetical protein